MALAGQPAVHVLCLPRHSRGARPGCTKTDTCFIADIAFADVTRRVSEVIPGTGGIRCEFFGAALRKQGSAPSCLRGFCRAQSLCTAEHGCWHPFRLSPSAATQPRQQEAFVVWFLSQVPAARFSQPDIWRPDQLASSPAPQACLHCWDSCN